jgi:RNA polymerase sigma-B factor
MRQQAYPMAKLQSGNGRDRRSDELTLARRYQRFGDRAARDALVTGLLPLARRLARRYRGRSEPMEDLTQVATLGLLKAIDRFDAERGVALSTYAVPVILGELRHHLRDNVASAHVPRPLQERATRTAHAVNDLTAESGRAPRRAEVALRTGLEPHEVAEALEVAARREPRSLEACEPGEEGEQLSLLERLGADDERLHLAECRVSLARGLRALNSRERASLVLRVVEDQPYREVGQQLGISPSHASRLVQRALAKARAAGGLTPVRRGQQEVGLRTVS